MSRARRRGTTRAVRCVLNEPNPRRRHCSGPLGFDDDRRADDKGRRIVALAALVSQRWGSRAAAGADVDQCAPPGVESASALPTNLASAAKGPEADRYTTARRRAAAGRTSTPCGLGTPGVLTVGTLSDAPPSICIDAKGQFTGFDNELLRAIAAKLGLKVNFVGTEFSGLLAQVASRRFDVGSSSITTTDARRKTVGFTNGYDFGYFSLVVPPGSAIKGFSQLAAGPAHRRGAGHRAGGVRRRHPAPGPGEVPRLQHRLRQPEDPPDRRLGGAVAAGDRHGPARRPGARSSRTPSAWTTSSPTRWPRRTSR